MDVLKITMVAALRKMIKVVPAGIVLSNTLDILEELIKEKELERLRACLKIKKCTKHMFCPKFCDKIKKK
ncbi:hypothetical protein AALB64_18470, partial [Lachnospiraceae bacterium 45-P1]